MKSSNNKKILVIGSGYVAKPCVEYLTRRSDYFVTVGSRSEHSTKELVESIGRPNCKAILVDAENKDNLEQAISDCDLVVSLLPYIHHVKVFEAALKFKKHVVTTSYVSKQARSFDKFAKQANLCFYNEVGVDPGVDHIYAVRIIDRVHKKGGKVNSFISFCGGLPSIESSGNPLRYKFSWSARGVLLALKNDAEFLEDGEVKKVAGKDLMDYCRDINIGHEYKLIGYPNRNSLDYLDLYNIPEAKTVLRGTLRYPEIKEFIVLMHKLNLLSMEPCEILNKSNPKSIKWSEFLASRLKCKDNSEESITEAIKNLNITKSDSELKRVIDGLKWIGILSDTPVEKAGTILDALYPMMESKMRYEEGQVDVITLKHIFDVEYPGGKNERIICEAVWKGESTEKTAMAKCVGVPCGITAELILDGVVLERGVLAPLSADLADPIYERLQKEGVTMEETVVPF